MPRSLRHAALVTLGLALACSAALLLGAAPPAAPAADGFDRWFHDETLRIDYFHAGHAKEEIVSLDQLYRQGAWAGSRRDLVDGLDNGGYYAHLYDAATGTLIWSRGFDSYFGEYRTSGPAAEGVRRTYHESVLAPLPRAKARFELHVRGRDKTLSRLFAADIDPAAYTIHREPPRGSVTVVEAANGGAPHTALDIAILGEGYRAADRDKFESDVRRFTALLLAQQPFAAQRDHISVRGVLAPSEDAGCDEPSRGLHRRTALGATFDSLGSERYVLTEDNRALRDVAAHVPYDAVIVMINHVRYGGGGIYNFYATFTADNQWSPYVFLHEFGHSFAGLADEYYTSSVAYNEFYPRGIEPTEPNITALLPGRPLKWNDLVTPGTAVPTPWEKAAFDEMDRGFQKVREALNETIAKKMRAGAPDAEVQSLKDEAERQSKAHADRVDAYLAKSRFAGKVGAFEGAGYAAEGLYRSQLDCIMFTKGQKPWCAACVRGIDRVIARYLE